MPAGAPSRCKQASIRYTSRIQCCQARLCHYEVAIGCSEECGDESIHSIRSGVLRSVANEVVQAGGVLGSKDGYFKEEQGVSKAWAQDSVTIGGEYVSFRALGIIAFGKTG